MMPVPLKAVVVRHMKQTGRFVEAATSGGLPFPVDLAESEVPIGAYSNPSPWANCGIVFTTEAIYAVEPSGTVRIGLSDIVGYEFPKSKQDVSGVRVLTADGFRFIRIAGSRGPHDRVKDAFDFIMLVGKIAGHNERQRERNGGE
jgi:hypothetical protein